MNRHWYYRGLIYFSSSNFERIKSLRSQLRTELIKFEIKDYFVNDSEIQEPNCINPGAKLKKRFSVRKQTPSFLNQLFILFFLILGETGSTKTALNLIQNVDQIYLLPNLLVASVSLAHTVLLRCKDGSSPTVVPCFPQTWTNKPCLSSSPGSLSWERSDESPGHSLAL